MKYIPILAFLLASPLSTLAQDDQNMTTADLLQSQKDFLNLPEEQRDEFAEHYKQAAQYFQQKRIFETLDSLDEASKILEKNVAILNLYGSCYVEMRAFDKALTAFRKAQELDPKNRSVNFNIAEVLFVTHNWQEAHDALVDVSKKIPEEDISLGRLVEFKILLCKIRLEKDAEVTALSEKYDYQDDSPFYYYAKAAIAYDAEEEEEAAEWLARANRIFQNPNLIAPWQDTLVEFGYIKSFYGEDLIPTE
ncbi:tetratricopeptide repeat protein [Luteolibacter sp. AS25]|uniref:tetratricopeptide repeat protein n=1 Tax=Luteolibacter sp. AS25 TaxID=3135776 RepID=UPI00398AE9E0